MPPPAGTAQKKNFQAATDENGVLTFRTTAALKAGDGITVFIAWPKGFISPPSAIGNFAAYIEENFRLFVALVAAGFGIPLFFIIWWLVGRDPPRGTIIPEFAPLKTSLPPLPPMSQGRDRGSHAAPRLLRRNCRSCHQGIY